jgi:hypothetical protein
MGLLLVNLLSIIAPFIKNGYQDDCGYNTLQPNYSTRPFENVRIPSEV